MSSHDGERAVARDEIKMFIGKELWQLLLKVAASLNRLPKFQIVRLRPEERRFR